MNELIQAVLEYQSAGLSVVPVTRNKKPAIEWKYCQMHRMDPWKIQREFKQPEVSGVGIVGGAVSGFFDGLDFDIKNDLDGSLFDRFKAELKSRQSELLYKLVIASTRNKGFHLYFRGIDTLPYAALARRPASEEELFTQPGITRKVLVETVGSRRYIIVPPSVGYTFLQGSLLQLPVLHQTERALLHSIARGFDIRFDRVDRYYSTFAWSRGADSPIIDFNRRGDAIRLLSRHGWSVLVETAEKTTMLRPGKKGRKPSGDFHHLLRLFTVFTDATVFEPLKGYSPSAVFALLECNLDFHLAAKRLVEMGYGVPYKARWPTGIYPC